MLHAAQRIQAFFLATRLVIKEALVSSSARYPLFHSRGYNIPRSEPCIRLPNGSDILILRGGLIDAVTIVGHHHSFTNKPLTFEVAKDRQTQIRELSISFYTSSR